MAVERGANLDRFSGISDTGAALAKGIGDLGVEQGRLNLTAADQALSAHNAQMMAALREKEIEADKWKVTQEIDQRRRESQSAIMLRQADMMLTKSLMEKRARQAQLQESVKNANILGDAKAAQQKMKELAALNDEVESTEGLLSRTSGRVAGVEKIKSLYAGAGKEALDNIVAGEKSRADYLLNTATGSNLVGLASALKTGEAAVPDSTTPMPWWTKLGLGASGDKTDVPFAGSTLVGGVRRMDPVEDQNKRAVNAAIAHSISEVLTGEGKGKIDGDTLNMLSRIVQLSSGAGAGNEDAIKEGQQLLSQLRSKGVDSSMVGYMISAYHKGLGRMIESGAMGAGASAAQYAGAQNTPMGTPDFEQHTQALKAARDHVQQMMAGAASLGVQGVGEIGDEAVWAEKRKHLTNAYQAVLQDFLDDGEIDHPELLNALPETLKTTLLAKQQEMQQSLKGLAGNEVGDDELFRPGNVVGQGNVRFDLPSAQGKMDSLKRKALGLGRTISNYQNGTPTSVGMQLGTLEKSTNDWMKNSSELGNLDDVFGPSISGYGDAASIFGPVNKTFVNKGGGLSQ